MTQEDILTRVDEKLDAIRDWIGVLHGETLRRLEGIESRVGGQNGRVTKLEVDRDVALKVQKRLEEQNAEKSEESSRVRVARIGVVGAVVTAAITSTVTLIVQLRGGG